MFGIRHNLWWFWAGGTTDTLYAANFEGHWLLQGPGQYCNYIHCHRNSSLYSSHSSFIQACRRVICSRCFQWGDRLDQSYELLAKTQQCSGRPKVFGNYQPPSPPVLHPCSLVVDIAPITCMSNILVLGKASWTWFKYFKYSIMRATKNINCQIEEGIWARFTKKRTRDVCPNV